MFDNVPPNLPVEPANQIPPPPMTPSGVQPKPIVVSQMKKEPEDIFADVNVVGDDLQAAANTQDIYSAPHKSALPLIAVIIAGVVVLGGIVFAVWYFLLRQDSVPSATVTPQKTEATVPQQQPEIIEQPPITANEVTTIPPAGSNIPLPVSTNETATTETPPEAPAMPTDETSVPASVVLTEGVDTDADGLTDAEEVLLGTNNQIADTDGDGFKDGSETVNLYSPSAASRQLSADPNFSAAVWEAKTPVKSFAWSFLRPQTWLLNGESVMQAILTTESAARFVFSLAASSDLPQTTPFKTKSGLDAMRSPDGLTTYVYSGDAVIAVTYDLNGATTYEYRTLYDAIINSLRLQ
ncbi:MAG: hypothetical protein RDU25_05010 [Patescibacteria group bacterium]|nr:hypothetical protein [Patescibacteria group bacterium]